MSPTAERLRLAARMQRVSSRNRLAAAAARVVLRVRPRFPLAHTRRLLLALRSAEPAGAEEPERTSASPTADRFKQPATTASVSWRNRSAAAVETAAMQMPRHKRTVPKGQRALRSRSASAVAAAERRATLALPTPVTLQ